MKGKLVIISAPSGSGKSTMINHLLGSGLNLEFAISATTRSPRGKEIEGRDYYFLTVDDFRRKVMNNEFTEWEEVYPNQLYGTLVVEIERVWSGGNHVLFDVDVKGALTLKNIYREDSLSIFIMPPSIPELKKRLLQRGTDAPADINTRVQKAGEEIKMADQFDKIIINDDVDRARQEIVNIVSGFLKNG
jgi:guanylate kinase